MFQIFVDSAANLPAVTAKQYDINVISFVNLVDGKEITCFDPNLSPEEERQKGTEYYQAMSRGCEIKTGLISTAAFEEAFRSALEADQDVLYFSLSKNISGTYNSARLASEELLDEFGDNTRFVWSTLSMPHLPRESLPSMQARCVPKECLWMRSLILWNIMLEK